MSATTLASSMMQPICVNSARTSSSDFSSMSTTHGHLSGEVHIQLFATNGTRTRFRQSEYLFWRDDRIGTKIDETGTLLPKGAAFVLRRDLSGRWMLHLHRVPVDHVERRVRITGTVVGDGLIDVNSLIGQK